jgi:aryl-alcohol dehydrogenase-like predicted oxidoreductase
MKYKTLGDSGLLVSTLCLGTMTLEGFWKAIGTVDRAGAGEIIKASIGGGSRVLKVAAVET